MRFKCLVKDIHNITGEKKWAIIVIFAVLVMESKRYKYVKGVEFKV